MSTPVSHRRGLLLMLGATLCWASAGVLMRTQSVTDGWEVTFWRSLFMTLFLSAVLAVQYGAGAWRRVCAVGLPGLISGLLWSIMFVCFIVALSRTTVANTLVVCSISPFMAALFAWAFLKERVPVRTWLAMAAAFTGIVAMFMESLGGGGAAGNLIALAIPLCFGLNVVLLRKMHAEVDMVPTILIAGVLSCVMTLPFCLPFDARPTDFPNFIALGVVQLGLGCLCMVWAARHLAAAEIGLLAEMETLFGVLSVWVLVGEVPSRMTLIGGGIVVTALAINAAVGLRDQHRLATAVA
ncbi:MAG: DMT family transporter [Burkholderiales bacterium]|nr:DMT family transporter [Burkholderiales bacterium]